MKTISSAYDCLSTVPAISNVAVRRNGENGYLVVSGLVSRAAPTPAWVREPRHQTNSPAISG